MKTEYQLDVERAFEAHKKFLQQHGWETESDMGGDWYEKTLSESEYLTLGGNTGADDFYNVLGSIAEKVNICHMNDGGEVLYIYELHHVLKIDGDTIVDEKLLVQFVLRVFAILQHPIQ